MIAGQLELPLTVPVDDGHKFTLRWAPEGKPDGTYTLTCACSSEPMLSHSWSEWQQQMDAHREAA